MFWVLEHPTEISGKNLTHKNRHIISHYIFKTDHWIGQWISISDGTLPRTPLGELTALPRPLVGRGLTAPPQEDPPRLRASAFWASLCRSPTPRKINLRPWYLDSDTVCPPASAFQHLRYQRKRDQSQELLETLTKYSIV